MINDPLVRIASIEKNIMYKDIEVWNRTIRICFLTSSMLAFLGILVLCINCF